MAYNVRVKPAVITNLFGLGSMMGVTHMEVERVLTVRQSNGKYVTPGQVSVRQGWPFYE